MKNIDYVMKYHNEDNKSKRDLINLHCPKDIHIALKQYVCVDGCESCIDCWNLENDLTKIRR